MATVEESLFSVYLAQTGDQLVLVGENEAYHRNAERIHRLATLDDQLGVESVRAEGENIYVTLRPGFTWTDSRFVAIRKLLA